MASLKMLTVLCCCIIVLVRPQDVPKPTEEEVESVFGVTVTELRSLVEKQFFVSSCQYGVIKKLRMYENAKEQCEQQLTNGRIAVMRDAKENAVVNNLFVATYGHGLDNNFMSNNPYNFIWVGLERESDGDWKWDDGTSLNYTNWKRNHPKGQNSYVRMNKNGYWDSTSNINHHPVLCEHTGKYVIFKKKMTYNEASDVCTKMSMSLAKSTNSEDNEDLMKAAGYSLGSPSLESKMFEEENTWIWIAGIEAEDGNLRYKNGDNIEYTNFEEFYGSESVGNEDTDGTEETDEDSSEYDIGNGRMTLSKKDGTWKLLDKDQKRSFACQCNNPGTDNIIAPKATNEDEEDDENFETESVVGSCKKRFYIYLEQLVYPEAVVECRRKGLVMAKVESEAENDHVLKEVNRAYNGEFSKRLYNDMNWYWLGGSDDMMEGQFRWEDGTDLNFTNWGRGQPDNAHAITGGQQKISVYRGTGLWDDSHSYRKRPFVCFDATVTLEQELSNDCDGLAAKDGGGQSDKFGGNINGMDEPDDTDDTDDTDIKTVKKCTKKSTPSGLDEGTEEIDEEEEEEECEEEVIVMPESQVTSDDEVTPTQERAVPRDSFPEGTETRDECIEWEYQGSYHIPTVTKTFDEANAHCEERGMGLASIYSESDNARIRNLVLNRVPVSGYVLATKGELSWYWIGLQLDETDNEPKWMNGNRTIYEKFAPRNRNMFVKRTGKTAVGVSKLDGSWEWRGRDSKYMFICEKNDWKCSMTRAVPIDETCIGHWESKRVYSYIMEYALFNQSQAICKKRGGRLVFPETTEENEMVRQFAQEQYPLPQNIKQNPSKRENWIWIDVNDMEDEGDYKHTDGSNVDYFNWGNNQPDNLYPRRGGQDAVAMNKNTGKWFDVFHDHRVFQIVCQKDVAQCVVRGSDTSYNEVSPTATEPSPNDSADKPSFIVPPSSWRAQVGSTVTFEAQWEPADSTVEWVHNGKICIDRPDSGKELYVTEDNKFVVSNIDAKKAGLYSCILTASNGQKTMSTVAITLAETRSFILIHGEETLAVAKSACESLGGGLACPKSEEEMMELLDLHSGNVWLGFVDDAGKWSDHNGQDLTYTSWDDGEPLTKSGGKQGVQMLNYGSEGKWVVAEADSKAAVLCERVPVKVDDGSVANVEAEEA